MILSIFSLFRKKTKIFFIICFFSTFLLSIAESVSIGVIIPIISLMISPKLFFTKYNLFSNLDFLNIHSDNDVRIFVLYVAFSIIFSTTILKLILLKVNSKFASHLGVEISNIFISRVLNSEYSYLQKIKFDDYLTFSSKNIEYFIYYIVLPFINLISSIFQITFLILLLLYIDIYISFFTFIFFTSVYLMFNIFSKKLIQRNNIIIQQSTPLIISNVRNILNGFKEIQLYKKINYYKNKINRTYNLSFSAQSNSLYLAAFPKYIIESLAMFFLLSLLFYKIKSSENIIEIIPFLTTFILALQRLLPNFQLAYSSYTNLKTYSYILDDIHKTLHTLETNKEPINSEETDINFEFESVKFNAISFSYSNKIIIDKLSNTINKGDRVFLNGKSGSGKSTFIDIFCGFLKINSGSIIINNNLNFYSVLKHWKTKIAYIPQKINILNGSFLENITYSNSSENDNLDKCISVSKLCGLHDIIIKNKDKYGHQINSDFNNLSGGQLKRLAIARALYSEKSILIFDEATSGLDQDSESDIINILNDLGNSTTIIFISHNLNFIDKFSKKITF
jgi:ABC-type multidrug transport system fused ATPase/permease subunit